MVSRLCYCNTFCACATERGEGVSGFRDLPVRERQRGASWEGTLRLRQEWKHVDISRLLLARMGHEPGACCVLGLQGV